MTPAIPVKKPRATTPKAPPPKTISTLERALDDALKGTFPASDPVSSLRMAVQGPQPDHD